MVLISDTLPARQHYIMKKISDLCYSCERLFSLITRFSGCYILSVLLLFLSGHNAIGQPSQSGLPFIRSFQTVDYKAGIHNYDIAQSREGLIYIGNNFGLLEYDGEQWRTYGVSNGTRVRSVAIDPRGRIYVGCQSDFGYFFPDKTGRLAYTSLIDKLAPEMRNFDEVWRVYIDRGTVYFCTFTNIFIYDGEKISIIKPAHFLDHSFMVNHQLYTNEQTTGLNVLEGAWLRGIRGGEFFKNHSISSLVLLHQGQFLVSTFQEGIFLLTDGKVEAWNPVLQELFKQANINCMIRLKNGNLLAGTQNSGLLLLSAQGELLMHLNRGSGLENRTIFTLMEDDLQNVWAGQNNGVIYVELGSPFTVINEQSGLPGSGYTAYLDDDHFYAGTNTGLYVQKANSKGNFELVENITAQTYQIGRYGNDLLTGYHNGTLRVEGKKAYSLSRKLGTWIFLPLARQPHKMIEGTYAGLNLYTLKNNHWEFTKPIKGFYESSRLIQEDNENNIWISHGYKGAYKLELNAQKDSVQKITFYGEDKGFPSNKFINLFKIRNELTFTGEHGVYTYNKATDSFVPDDLFTRHFGIRAQFWFIQEDALGNIYFIGQEHLGVFRKNAMGEYVLHSNNFNKIRKYLNDDLQSIIILKNNEVLFGAKDGFIHYNPLHTEIKSSFNTLIRKVSITNDGDSVLFTGNYTSGDSVITKQPDESQYELPYRFNSVLFNFSATSYDNDTELYYQFYLDNYEQNWSAWTRQPLKEYTNLKEGSYTFHVRAKNASGDISKEAIYRLTINPPWYRSVLAYIFYGLSGMGILFTGFNLLDRKYLREQQKMVIRQEQELNEKNKEMEKMSQLSQEQITHLQTEKLESEIRHVNNELATATMHLLNKNEFIVHVKSNLNQIVKKNASEDFRKELTQIVKDIENNISADSDWEHFQFHFDRVHGDFTNRFRAQFTSLSPQEIKLSAYLRMNLSSKEIAQLLNISVRGVEISRYRLRKKLQLDRNQNLQDFILNF